MLTWVVGAGGLLGAAVSRVAELRFIGSPVPWTDPSVAAAVLESDLARFVTDAGDGAWSIVWAAGGAVVASSAPDVQAETDIVERFLVAVRDHHPKGDGALFLASSAGGVYAGSRHPPFDEATLPRPLSAYGEAKLAHEELATRLLVGAVPIVIGRLSNLYGPGQRLVKSQGLVSHLCLATARRRSLNLFVPMDTLRDYLQVDDAATMIVSLVVEAARRQPHIPVVRNLASGRPTSVARLVRVVQQVAHRPVRIALGSAPTVGHQPRDLRIATAYPDTIARAAITPLPVGVKAVYEHTLTMLRGLVYADA